MRSVRNSVLKYRPVIDPTKSLGHWVVGRTSESLT